MPVLPAKLPGAPLKFFELISSLSRFWAEVPPSVSVVAAVSVLKAPVSASTGSFASSAAFEIRW